MTCYISQIDIDPDVILSRQYSLNANDQSLRAMDKIGSVWNSPPMSASTFLSVYRVLSVARSSLTRVVGASYVSLIKLRNALRGVEEIRNSTLVKKYEELFISVKTWGAFEYSDIKLNKIHSFQTVPGFVTEFEQELDKKPGVAPDVCYLFPWLFF